MGVYIGSLSEVLVIGDPTSPFFGFLERRQ